MELWNNKKYIISFVLSIVGIIFIFTGITYGYVYYNLKGKQSVIINSGCLKIVFEDENEISLVNATPIIDSIGMSSIPYTYTITNVCTTDTYFETTFNILDTSIAGNQNKVKLYLSGSSIVGPRLISSLPITTLPTPINNVSLTYILDTGYIKPNEEKTFDLRMWIDSTITSMSGGIYGKIVINSYPKEGPSYLTSTSGFTVYKNNTITNNSDYNPNFNYIAPYSDEGNYTQTSGLFKADGNDNDPIYYFRGNVLNNYVKFGKYASDSTINYTDSSGNSASTTHNINDDMIWRIVRINEDGSLRLILDDIISFSEYSSDGTSLINNLVPSTIKTTLDDWYTLNLSDVSQYISDQIFCYSTNTISRLTLENKTPTFTCTTNDIKYTVSNSIGNGLLSNPIGLITSDEIAYAGAKNETSNTTNYLYKNITNWWTMSPSNTASNSYSMFSYNNDYSLGTNAIGNSGGVRPVINITSDAILSGTGVQNDPYVITGLYSEYLNSFVYSDFEAPIIVDAYASAERIYMKKPITIIAKDNINGTGISGYYISSNNVTPSIDDINWITTNNTTYITSLTYPNGTYYIWAKDASGNISTPRAIEVIRIQPITLTITTTRDNTNALIEVVPSYIFDNATYKYYYKLTSDENYTLAYTGSETSFTIQDLVLTSNYDIKIEMLYNDSVEAENQIVMNGE